MTEKKDLIVTNKKLDLTDNILIPKAHLEKVCKIGQKEKCCKYLGLSVKGFFCSKNTEYKELIDKKKDMIANGDNCDGYY